MFEKNEMNNASDLKVETVATSVENPVWRRIGLIAALLIAAFLLGLVPMWLSQRETVNQRDAAQQSLRLSHLQNRLAASAINARRGEYELARTSLSDFFTELRAEANRLDNQTAMTKPQRETVQPILAAHDELITLLARSDPAAADKLSDLYVNYSQTMNLSPPQIQ